MPHQNQAALIQTMYLIPSNFLHSTYSEGENYTEHLRKKKVLAACETNNNKCTIDV